MAAHGAKICPLSDSLPSLEQVSRLSSNAQCTGKTFYNRRCPRKHHRFYYLSMPDHCKAGGTLVHWAAVGRPRDQAAAAVRLLTVWTATRGLRTLERVDALTPAGGCFLCRGSVTTSGRSGPLLSRSSTCAVQAQSQC